MVYIVLEKYLLKTPKAVPVYIAKRTVAFVGDALCRAQISGWDYIKSCRLNKLLSFTHLERQYLGLNGLVPPGYLSQEEQTAVTKAALNRWSKPINKYWYLGQIRDRDEKTYFK